MTHQSEPIPLIESEGASDEVLALLRHARASGGPSEAQLARLGARVAPAVGLPVAALAGASPAVGTAPASAAGAAGGTPSIAPAAAGAAKVGAAAGAKGVLAGASAGVVLKGAGLVGALALGALTLGVLRGPAPEGVQPSPVSLQPSAAAEPPPAAHDRPVAPVVEPLELPSSEAPAAEGAAEVEGAPLPTPPARKPLEDRAGPGVRVQPPSELALMQRAQEQRGQPTAMLRTLARHARQYPRGMLAQERDVLRIEALVQLGRYAQARQQAARMERAHPGSPHLVRVRALLADAP